MTHEIYLKSQADALIQKTSTNNKPIKIILLKHEQQKEKCRIKSAINLIMNSNCSGKTSSFVKWALCGYEPINELEYE